MWVPYVWYRMKLGPKKSPCTSCSLDKGGLGLGVSGCDLSDIPISNTTVKMPHRHL